MKESRNLIIYKPDGDKGFSQVEYLARVTDPGSYAFALRLYKKKHPSILMSSLLLSRK